MGNSRYYQFLFSKIPMLTMIEGQVTIGSSGAVSSSSGNSVASVTKLGTGIYQIQLTENYNAFIGAKFVLEAPVTGSSVADGSFVAGTLYQITAVGTTSWASVGLNAGLTPAVGQVFVATGIGGAGTGTAKAIGTTAIFKCEIPNTPNVMLTTSTLGLGGLVVFTTLNASAALTSPTAGSVIRFNLMLRNSSNQF